MLVLKATNVNDAYSDALWAMRMKSIPDNSRNGPAKTCTTPVATVYRYPKERMLFDVARNANPFFHIMEGIWMLAGRNDVKFVSKFAGNMGNFSDDGVTLNGAYGHRWRNHFGRDQILDVIKLLRTDPNTRRAVISMWDPIVDGAIVGVSKDVPCNTQIYFRIKEDTLDMTVCNRSNDIIWGCYGANAVHMSMLQEFVANAIGVPIGTYTQISNDWHIYEQHWGLLDYPTDPRTDVYLKDWTHVELLDLPQFYELFLEDCEKFIDNVLAGEYYGSYENAYVNWVLQPMVKAWVDYKIGKPLRAIAYAESIKDTAVQKACIEWIKRRIHD